LPIIIKAKNNKSNNAKMIRDFKKATAIADVVEKARARRYFQKPSQLKAVNKIMRKRLQRKIRSLKKTKNISSEVIDKMVARLSNS